MLIVLAVLVMVLAAGWLGLQVRSRPFAPYPDRGSEPATIPLPQDLPAPVERFYRAAYGDAVPQIHSVVVTGRGRIRQFGLWLPARFRFTHDAGQGYRHYIETTWLRIPFFKVNERYVDGTAVMELPGGTYRGAKLDQAANVGMWAELSSAAPAVLLTDPRVSWRPVDDDTALLRVPFGEAATDTLVVRFDPASGRIASLEAMRYRDAKSPAKILWIAANEGDETIGTPATAATGTATWLDQGTPWAYFKTEDLVVNVDVDEYLRSRGL